MKTTTYIALLALTLFLHGCGFALRGSEQLPASLERTYIQTPREGVGLGRELRRQLDQAGAQAVGSEDNSSAVLRIIENETGQRILSVTTTGGPEEYEVYHLVRFELQVDRKRVFGPDELTLTRDYTYDKTDVLGKRREYDSLRAALRKEMASLILRRLTLAPEVP